MAMDEDLVLTALRFLNQFDTGHMNKYYMKDVKLFFKHFARSYPDANRYGLNSIIDYVKKRKYVYFIRGQMVVKPLFVNISDGKNLAFIMASGTENNQTYYVCRVCDRGFGTVHGLKEHRQSQSHEQFLNTFIRDVEISYSGVYKCPVLDCPKVFENSQSFITHLRTEKSVVVQRPQLSEQEKQAAAELRSRWYCTLCQVHCNSEINFNQHLKGKKHKLNDFRSEYRRHRPALLGSKNGLEISLSCLQFGVKDSDSTGIMELHTDIGSPVTVEMRIENKSESAVNFVSCIHYSYTGGDSVSLRDPSNVTSGLAIHPIPASSSYTVFLTVKPACYGRNRIPVLFSFELPRVNGYHSHAVDSFKILREVLMVCRRDDGLYEELQPTAPYQKPEVKQKVEAELIHSDNKPDFQRSMNLQLVVKLPDYPIPSNLKQSIKKVANPDARDEFKKEFDLDSLEFSNYSVHFNNLIHIEECQMNVDIDHYTMHNATMNKDARSSKTPLLRLKVPGLAENRPSVLKGDKIYARVDGDSKKYEGYVHFVERDEVKIGFYKRFHATYINGTKVTIEFTVNRLSIKLEHRAVTWAGEGFYDLEPVLFPTKATFPQLCDLPSLSLSYYSRDIATNLEQATAVNYIVAGTSRPAPYLIYGPPGTGKTHTLVEAIKQVYKKYPNAKILACAPQNAAADLMTERLIKDCVDKKDILRINALSRAYDDLTPKVRRVSNFRSITGVATTLYNVLATPTNRADMEVFFPSKEDLKQKRILVTTLVTAGRLVSARMSDHFTHIFIDEAGHATEPETVIPLAGLLTVNMKSGGQVVLAGDPEQLGPVIRSSLAKESGLDQSLLARLMKSDVYKRDPKGQYNRTFVTKLINSFRSHPAILEVPNERFYDGELRACADPIKREMFCEWEGLPTKGFPLIFHGVIGEDMREESSPSWFNPDEILTVISYVEKLMDCKSPRVKSEMIGIISPYHQQVIKIKRALQALELRKAGHERNYAGIKVGSVEKFQGDEREIIIISTVRSQDAFLNDDSKFNLGFVRNKKRFNVAVTRAKSLLIVVGNPAILKGDDNWQRLISHIEEGGGYVGAAAPDEVDSGVMDDLTRKMKQTTLQDYAETSQEEASEVLQQAGLEWSRKE